MKNCLLFVLTSFLFLSCAVSRQGNNDRTSLEIWKKAVVNIEKEGGIYAQYYIDSVCNAKKLSGFYPKQVDSVRLAMSSQSRISTGTAVYAVYNKRKYLITAKHVLSDDVLVQQKIYEKRKGITVWESIDAIFPRISVRTPLSAQATKGIVNNYAVFNNNFIKGPKPYFFISDSTGDGLAVISLQEPWYRLLDTLLQTDGYEPMPLEEAIDNKQISLLDDVTVIGFPEMISIVARFTPPNGVPLHQRAELVAPFVVKGSVAMYDPLIQHFYVDVTITPGNSGSPIIKDGKLIGIVSSINKYKIIDENLQPIVQNLYGIGHLVNVINISELLKKLDDYKEEESKLPKDF
jgi:Trypsin-like peptidase domain